MLGDTQQLGSAEARLGASEGFAEVAVATSLAYFAGGAVIWWIWYLIVLALVAESWMTSG